jgi:hypothetical protein
MHHPHSLIGTHVAFFQAVLPTIGEILRNSMDFAVRR